MNVELLRKVQAAIVAEPERFDMSFFSPHVSTCGTACCIAGHTLAVSGRDPDHEAVEPLAAGLLQIEVNTLSCADETESSRLFYVSSWPEPFKSDFKDLCVDDNGEYLGWTPNKRHRKAAAEIASRRIDHFIATEGRE